MNWDIIEGKWTQLRGTLKTQWGKLTDDDIELIAGKKDRLLGLLQERYGKTRDAAESDLDRWLSAQEAKNGDSSRDSLRQS